MAYKDNSSEKVITARVNIDTYNDLKELATLMDISLNQLINKYLRVGNFILDSYNAGCEVIIRSPVGEQRIVIF